MQSSDLKNLNVAIIGAGYGGASTAKAISLLGANVTVYERASRATEVGAGIGLRPSSLAQFRQWGIEEAIKAVSSPSDAFDIFTPAGALVHREPWPETAEFGVTTHLIHRRDFIDALLSVLPAGMVQFGHKLAAIEDRGDRTVVTFANGKSVTADLVIGADGIKSQVRCALFSDKPPVFAREHAYRAVFSTDLLPGVIDNDDFRMYFDPGTGRKLYLLPLRHRGQVSFDITVPSDDPTWSPTLTRELLVASLDGFDERFRRITETIDLATVNARSAHDIDSVDSWHTDSVTLVGDAAHAMLHHQGQGANSAVLDAGGIADALEKAGSVREALALYQATRKPVTDELQRISREGWTEDTLDDAFPGQHGDH
jgi:salicylate hydroxylase